MKRDKTVSTTCRSRKGFRARSFQICLLDPHKAENGVPLRAPRLYRWTAARTLYMYACCTEDCPTRARANGRRSSSCCMISTPNLKNIGPVGKTRSMVLAPVHYVRFLLYRRLSYEDTKITWSVGVGTLVPLNRIQVGNRTQKVSYVGCFMWWGKHSWRSGRAGGRAGAPRHRFLSSPRVKKLGRWLSDLPLPFVVAPDKRLGRDSLVVMRTPSFLDATALSYF